MKKIPPFQITPHILSLSQEIGHELGVLSGAKLYPVPVKLRRENKIKTIQSSLSIEGNTLTIKQITAILEGQRIIAPEKDIKEVKNAIVVYDELHNWNSLSTLSFKKAHRELMKNIINTNGGWRSLGVGIFKGKSLAHMAPPAHRVSKLMDDLFAFINRDKSISWLIKACIFHYELEFIHPFMDGNGRMGRLWQQLLLMKENPIFEFISVESFIKKNQKQYYDVLSECDKTGESTVFIEFSLEQIMLTLKQYTSSTPSQAIHVQQRLVYARDIIKSEWFSRKDYMEVHKDISSSTASRDLVIGLQENSLCKKGSNNKVCYQFLKNK